MMHQPMTEPVPVSFLGRFNDAALKYQHAQKHFSELVGLMNGLLKGEWWKPEKVDGAPERTVRVKILREPTPEWSLVLGDLIHNLRGCLDYATCGMIEVADPTNNLKKIQFPFGRLGEALNSSERGNIKGITDAGLARLEEIRAEFATDLHFS